MKLSPNVQLRLGRAGVAVLGTHAVTGTWDMTPSMIALSEVASVSSEIMAMIPYFGNMLWMIIFFPTFSNVYKEIIMNNYDEKQKKEIILLTCPLLSLAFLIWA